MGEGVYWHNIWSMEQCSQLDKREHRHLNAIDSSEKAHVERFGWEMKGDQGRQLFGGRRTLLMRNS